MTISGREQSPNLSQSGEALTPSILNRILAPAFLVIFVACLVYAIRVATLGLGNTLYSDPHDFRQTQTAITCFYMLHDGYTVNYQTPVLGPLWHLPYEFPLYQWIVVAWYKTFGGSLDVAGRLVSFFFYLATLIPAYLVLPAFGVQRRHRLLFPIILAVSPYYLFWSRTFLIETAALFFSVSFAACVILYFWGRANGKTKTYLICLALLAVIFGVAGSAVKFPTFVGFAFAAAFYVFKDHLRLHPRWSPIFRDALLLAAIGIIPVALGVAWTHYGDSIKTQSPITSSLITNSKQMIEWCFGTLHQRLSPAVWKRILGHGGQVIDYDIAFWAGCLACLIITRRRWKEAAACAVLFVSVPAIFINLHWVHDYYMCANGIFLLFAVGFCILGILESPRGTLAGITAVLITIVVSIHGHRADYYSVQTTNQTFLSNAIQTIQDRSKEDSVVIYLGLDWSPTLPYYTRRRALMIPDWPFLSESQIRDEFKLLKNYSVGLIVIVQPNQAKVSQDRLLDLMREEGLPTDNILVLPWPPR